VTTSLSARVGNLNPRWNQTVTQDDVQVGIRGIGLTLVSICVRGTTH